MYLVLSTISLLYYNTLTVLPSVLIAGSYIKNETWILSGNPPSYMFVNLDLFESMFHTMNEKVRSRIAGRVWWGEAKPIGFLFLFFLRFLSLMVSPGRSICL
ncbi:hypothetical protein DFH27DRAFT_585135 [Peziza echinospora]|nr:hypothetical protein DFH27DRAFT_585135 [Peziza echinospora]